MKRAGLLCVLGVLIAGAAEPSASAPAEAPKPPRVRPPLTFIENQGQTDPQVKYYMTGARGTVFFTPSEVVFKLVEALKPEKDENGPPDEERSLAQEMMAPRRGVVIRLSFPGSEPASRLEGIGPLPGRINDFRGNDPNKWLKDIRTFSGVAYRDLYPGIDLEYRSENGALKRVLVVNDRAQVKAVRMKYAGTDALRVGQDGLLELVTSLGTIREEAIAVEAPGSPGSAAALKYMVLDPQTVGVLP